MNIVCCIQQMPDTAEAKIDPETNTLMRSGVESISNPYDPAALETALILRDKHGGWVTAHCLQGWSDRQEAGGE